MNDQLQLPLEQEQAEGECPGCATRNPATDPPCPECGADYDGKEGIPY